MFAVELILAALPALVTVITGLPTEKGGTPRGPSNALLVSLSQYEQAHEGVNFDIIRLALTSNSSFLNSITPKDTLLCFSDATILDQNLTLTDVITLLPFLTIPVSIGENDISLNSSTFLPTLQANQSLKLQRYPNNSLSVLSGLTSKSNILHWQPSFSGAMILDALVTPPLSISPTSTYFGLFNFTFLLLDQFNLLDYQEENDTNSSYTIFAPTDMAWLSFFAESNCSFTSMSAADVNLLIASHVVQAPVPLYANTTYSYNGTASTTSISVSNQTFLLMQNGTATARIISPDNLIFNGVLHIIDAVLAPFSFPHCS